MMFKPWPKIPRWENEKYTILTVFFALSIALTAYMCRWSAQDEWDKTKRQLIQMELKVGMNGNG